MRSQEKREQLIKTLKRVITDLEKGYDGFMFLYDIICEPKNAVTITTLKDIYATMDKVKALYEFYCQHPSLFFEISRGNGKTSLAFNFIKNYDAIVQAYVCSVEKAEKMNTAAQRSDSLRARFRLWLTPKKHCKHCCLFCEHFKQSMQCRNWRKNMNLDKIFNICKASKRFVVFRQNPKTQWIGDGIATYIVTHSPKLTPEYLTASASLKPQEVENTLFKNSDFPEGLETADKVDNENFVVLSEITINFFDGEYTPVFTSQIRAFSLQ